MANNLKYYCLKYLACTKSKTTAHTFKSGDLITQDWHTKNPNAIIILFSTKVALNLSKPKAKCHIHYF